jgi:Flp pilus assembly pilin Flp
LENLLARLVERVRDDKAASIVEYALLVILIAIIAVVAVQVAGTEVSTVFSSVANSLAN